MKMTVEINQRPNGDVELRIKRGERYVTPLEEYYEKALVQLIKLSLPAICDGYKKGQGR